MTGEQRERALSCTHGGLDAYGESRDSERTKFSNLSAWLKLEKRANSESRIFTNLTACCIAGKGGKPQMKRDLRDHSYTNLLPAEEMKEKEMMTDDQILKTFKAA